MMNMDRTVHPVWGLIEILIVTLLFFIGLWVLGPMIATDRVPSVIFYLIVAAGAIHVLWYSPSKLHHDPPEARGFGDFVPGYQGDGSFKHAWRVYALYTVIAAVMLVILAGWLDLVSLKELNWAALWIKLVGYVALGMVQAVFFFGFIQRRVHAIIPVSGGFRAFPLHRFSVAILTSAIFASYHLPNAMLIGFAFFSGCCWSWIFYKKPNILLLGISHALLGTILHRVVQLPMRIGPFYENPDLYILRTVFPGLDGFIGNLF